MKIIFLDVDGVLNTPKNYEWDHEHSYPLIEQSSVLTLNEITRRTESSIVVTSQWRYLVHSKNMTLDGFRKLFQSHGVRAEILGITDKDQIGEMRDNQIDLWLNNYHTQNNKKPSSPLAQTLLNINKISSYVILDDDPSLFHPNCSHLYIVDKNVGLTLSEVPKIISLLN